MSDALRLAQLEHSPTLDRLAQGVRTGLVAQPFGPEIIQMRAELDDAETALRRWAADYRVRVHDLLDRIRAAQDLDRSRREGAGLSALAETELQQDAREAAAGNSNRRAAREGR